MTDLNCKLPQPCDPQDPPKEKEPTPAFDLCVGDYALHWDGTHATISRPRTTPNGTYGSVTVADGCIVGYGECEIPTYTPAYCNPNPIPCTQAGQIVGNAGGGGTTVTVSSRAGNQLMQDNFGLYARTYVSGGSGVAVTGQGLQHDPYVISFAANAGGVQDGVVKGDMPVTTVERGGVTYVGLSHSGVVAGTYNGLTIDSYGRVVSATTSGGVGGANLTSEGELTLTPVADGTSIALEPSLAGGQVYAFGAYEVEVSQGGRVLRATRGISLQEGIYKLGAYNVGINEFGSIEIITQAEAPAVAGSFTTTDGKTVNYDDTGRITSITEGQAPQTAVGLPLPIREMYKFEITKKETELVANVRIDQYGQTLTQVSANNINEWVYALPEYVTATGNAQVYANGISANLDVSNRTLTIGTAATLRNAIDAHVTLVLRG